MSVVRRAASLAARPVVALFERARVASRAVLLHRLSQYLLPTPSALYFNRTKVTPPPVPRVPSAEWSNRERRAMLERSVQRLQGIEAKGPGLATINAIVAAGVVAALATQWGDSTLAGKVLLALSGLYAALSLIAPIYLVGPQPRHQLDGLLAEAAAAPDPDAFLGEQAAELWANNSERVTRLANLQDAARNELAIALLLLLAWAALGPALGVVMKSSNRTSSTSAATASAAVAGVRAPSKREGRGNDAAIEAHRACTVSAWARMSSS
jgi:hypothetical protein